MKYIFLALIGFICICSCNRDRKNISTNIETWGKSEGGLRSRIYMEKAYFSENENIRVYYQMQNVSMVKKIVWDTKFFGNNKIIVNYENGESAELTPLAVKLFSMFSPGGVVNDKMWLWLEPGQFLNIRCPPFSTGLHQHTRNPFDEDYFNLLDYFVLKENNKYTVQFIYEENRKALCLPQVKIKLESNVLRFSK